MTTRYYYWLVTREPDTGKPMLIFGSDKTEEDARQRGMELLGGLNFSIKRLPTRNISQASACVRGARLDKTHNLRTANQRQGHEKSLERLKERLAQRKQARSW